MPPPEISQISAPAPENSPFLGPKKGPFLGGEGAPPGGSPGKTPFFLCVRVCVCVPKNTLISRAPGGMVSKEGDFACKMPRNMTCGA